MRPANAEEGNREQVITADLVAPAGAQGVEGLAWEAEPGIVRRTALVPERGVRGGHGAAMPAGRDLFAPLPQLSCGPAGSQLRRAAGEGLATDRSYLARPAGPSSPQQPPRPRANRSAGLREPANCAAEAGQTPRVTGTRQQRGGGSLPVPVWAQELVLRRAAARGMRTCR